MSLAVVSSLYPQHAIFQGEADFDLELIENRTLDGHTQELYRPTLHA